MTFDKDQFFKPLPRRWKAALLATSASVACLGAIANAQSNTTGPQANLKFRNDYFGYGLSVGPRVTYTDNIGLQPSPFKNDEIAVSIGSNGSAIYATDRLAAIFDGSLDVSYLVDDGSLVASQDVGGVATATVSDNLFYVDVAASSSRQLAGENARFSRNINAGRNQRINVHNFSVSPYLNHQFADGSAAAISMLSRTTTPGRRKRSPPITPARNSVACRTALTVTSIAPMTTALHSFRTSSLSRRPAMRMSSLR